MTRPIHLVLGRSLAGLAAATLLVACGAPAPRAIEPPDTRGLVGGLEPAKGFGDLARCDLGAPAPPSGSPSEPEHVAGVYEVRVGEPEAVPGCPSYAVVPPAGGPHAAVPARCGVYVDVVPEAAAVASLRNGAVWVTYPPGTVLDELGSVVDDAWRAGHVLVSPHPAVTDGLVLTAWGRYLEVEGFDDPLVDEFLDTYLHGPQTPNLGGSCREGAGSPVVSFRSTS